MWENKFKQEYERLNSAQREAVENIYWPIMVVAWPGTGKTQIIALRTANIILKTWTNPENILITTFTEAWVVAIKKRLVSFLGSTWYKVTVSTIHSFAQDVIKSFPEKFVEFKLSTLVDEVESLEILKEITDNLTSSSKVVELTNDYDKYLYLRDIKSRISTLKQEWINSEKLEKIINKQEQEYIEELSEIKPTLKKYEQTKEKQEKHIKKLRELSIFTEEYKKYLREKSLYDFNDMINYVLEKFESDKELRQYYAESFQFIMLDEYQDTNNAQNGIIELILSESEESPNIMVVWDDDQSIYRFQWANIENMLDFSSKYSDAKVIVLENNYRSNQQILDLSSSLIDNNEERLSKKISNINKKLISSWNLKDDKTKALLFKASSSLEEETFVINNIKNLINLWEKKEEISIIVRQNKEVEYWSELLQKNEIEVESKLKTNILNSPYVNYLLNYLEIIDNPYSNEEKLLNVMRYNITGLHSIDIYRINRYLYQENYSRKIKLKIFDILQDFKKLDEIWLENLKKIEDFYNKILDFWTTLEEKSISEFMAEFIRETKLIEYIEKNWDFWDIEDIYTMLNKIKDWNFSDKNLNIKKILDKIELYKTYNYIIPRQILVWKKWGVQILTAHSSKWLEYNNVFIPWLHTANWESKRVIDKLKLPSWIVWEWIQEIKNNSLEEERRLLFVAITRARKNLFLSYPTGKDQKVFIESQFIWEMSWFFEEISEQQNNIEIKEVISNSIKNELIHYSDLDLEYISNFLENYKINPSDLNKFIENPLDFLHSVIFKYPFIDNKFTIFWKVYHRTLELFYLKYKSEQKLPEKSYLTATFNLLIDKEILTPEELAEAKEKWIKWLEWYYDEYSKKDEIPLVLEHSFRRKNLLFENIPISGVVDKIEKIWETTSLGTSTSGWQLAFFKDSVALIDYKTWKIKTLWVIKGTDRYWNKKEWWWEWKYFRQLLFYKLLCEVDFEFSSKFDVWKLALDFVEWKDWEYKLIEVEYNEEEYEYFKNELREAWKQINDINFWKELLKK